MRDIFAVQNTELYKSYICSRPSQLYKETNTGALQYYNEKEWRSGNDKGSIWLAFGLFKPSCSQRCLKPVHWTCRSLFRVFRMHNHNRSQISLAKTFHAAKAVVLQNGWTDMDFHVDFLSWYFAPSCSILHLSCFPGLGLIGLMYFSPAHLLPTQSLCRLLSTSSIKS